MAENQPKTALQGNIIQLWANGLSNAEIAAQLGCSTESVRSVKKNPDYKKLYYERQHEQIVELIPLAVTRLRSILRDDTVQATAAIAAVREVLDRSHLSELMDNTEKEIRITVNYE
jgi:DNA-binding CsgD family transcriptional regulator